MIDQPSAPDLLEAMAATLAESVVPACEGPPQHAARVVANLCRILAREFQHGADATSQTIADLQGLLGSDVSDGESLVAELEKRLVSADSSAGDIDDDELFRLLQANVDRRLAIAKPGYSGS